MKRSAYCWLSVCFLASCSSVNYVGIETYNPAEVTFPGKVGKVLVVNNAVCQPDNVGCEFMLFGEKVDTFRVKADSALVDACIGLGKAIADGPYFDDVLLYHDVVRTDDVYYEDQKLTDEQVRVLCEETDADAVVSLDRMLFDSKKMVKAYADGFVRGEIQVRVSGVLRSYIPGRPNPLATIHLSDSVYFFEEAPNLVLLDKVLLSSEEALRTAAEYVGAKASPNFVPHWENETRWFYSGMGTDWKEATAYARLEKWDKALTRWKHIYDKTNSRKYRARAASNIALGYEMETKLEEACEWATRSVGLFKETEGEDGTNTKLLELYVKTLQERMYSGKKLDMQTKRQ